MTGQAAVPTDPRLGLCALLALLSGFRRLNRCDSHDSRDRRARETAVVDLVLMALLGLLGAGPGVVTGLTAGATLPLSLADQGDGGGARRGATHSGKTHRGSSLDLV